jgi:hypothetical protein
VLRRGDVPPGETETIDCGAGFDLVFLRDFATPVPLPRPLPATIDITDPMTLGTYKLQKCEIVFTRR